MHKIFILLCMLSVHISAVGQSTFQKTYKVGVSPQESRAFTSQQTTDGGFIIGSYTYAPPYHIDIHLIKTNSVGNVLWAKGFGTGVGEMCRSIQQTSDGGFIIAGARNNYLVDINLYEICLFRTDSAGNFLWAKTYNINSRDSGQRVLQTMDGGYIVTGFTGSFGAGNYDVIVIKTDALGSILWSKTFGGIDDDRSYDIQPLPDSGYIIAGQAQSFSLGDIAYLVRIDLNGNIIWSKGYEGSYGYAVQRTADDGYVLVSFWPYAGFIKVDNTGNLVWTKSFPGNVYTQSYSGQQTNDGGYFLAGATQESTANETVVYAVKADSLGDSGCNNSISLTPINTAATQTLSPVLNEVAVSPVVTSLAFLTGSGVISSTLCSVGMDEMIKEHDISLSPNPSTTQLEIRNLKFEIRNIEIYNLLGEKVYSQQKITKNNLHTVDVSQLLSGIYFIKAKGERWERVAKFIKQ